MDDKKTATVEIEFFSLIEEVTKVKRKQFTLQARSPQLIDVLNLLFEEFGSQLEKAVIDKENKKLKPGVLVAINGKSTYLLEGLETSIRNGDRIVIGYAFRGG